MPNDFTAQMAGLLNALLGRYHHLAHVVEQLGKGLVGVVNSYQCGLYFMLWHEVATH